MKKLLDLFKSHKNIFLFLLIFALALFLRFYKLGSVPKSLHLDESVNGYVGRFVLENGVDLYNNVFPLFYFDKFGDFPPVIPMYIQALGIFLFGFTEVGSRFITAIIGCLITIQVFFISRLIFKDIRTSFFAMFAVAIIPWQIVFSRTSAEGLMASFFYLFGLFFLLYFWKKNKYRFLLFSLPFLLLPFFLYPSFRIFVPLSLIPLPLMVLSGRNLRKIVLSVFIVFCAFGILISFLNSTWGKGRADQVSIFHIVSGVEVRNTQLIFNDGDQNVFITRFFHNKPLGYAREFLNQYLSYFSGSFLFIDGGGEKTHQIPNSGQLYITFLILFILPLFSGLKKKNTANVEKFVFYYIIYLLLISVLPAALTVIAVPNPHRAMLSGIFLCFVAAYGFNTLLSYRFKKIYLYYFIYFLLLFETLHFAHNYIAHIDLYQFAETNIGAKEAVLYVKNEKNKYKNVFLTGNHYMAIYYLYYTNDLNPELAGRFQTKLILDSYKNLKFFDTDCATNKIADLKSEIKDKILIINKGTSCSLPEGVSHLADFMGSYNTIAYQAFVYKP